MSEKKKEKFETQFAEAIAQSVRTTGVPEKLRARLMERLEGEEQPPVPADLDLETITEFQGKLSEAVYRSQDWAPEDGVLYRTEVALAEEMKNFVPTERAVGAALRDDSLEGLELPEERVRFFTGFSEAVKKAEHAVKTPKAVRLRIEKALAEEGPKPSKIVPFPSRQQWKRGLSALTSVAAGFAIVFVTLFGSADVALANSVRADHTNCCRMVKMSRKGALPKKVKAMMDSKYGAVPVPPVPDSWQLRLSQLCKNDDGQEMIHLLYSREVEGGEETMSFHFLPDRGGEEGTLHLKESEVQQIGDGSFPVIAWLEGDWVCTATSSDLSPEDLETEAGQGL